MGEIIYSICVGGFLMISGVVMLVVLTKEERRVFKNDAEDSKEDDR